MNKFYIAFDIGGTNVKIGIFDANKKLVEKNSIKTVISKEKSEKTLIDGLLDYVENYCNDNKYGYKLTNLQGIGFTIPGPVIDNQVIMAVNINWHHKFDVISAVKKRFGNKIKVKLLNDANAAAVGEYKYGLKGKYKSICLMTLGTAVGGGIIIDDKLIEGTNGIAGEVGHIRVDYTDNATRCNCGRYGCLETVGSARGIMISYKKLFCKDGEKEVIINNKKISINDLTPEDIVAGAKAKDKKSILALEKSMDYLSEGMATLIYVFEPDVMVIGGGVSNAGKFIIDIINRYLREKVKLTHKLPKVVTAKLKNDAGIYGIVSYL